MMTLEINIHDPDIQVKMTKLTTGKTMLCFGEWPIPHTTWFLNEKDVQTLIDNLLKAQLVYIQESKNEAEVS